MLLVELFDGHQQRQRGHPKRFMTPATSISAIKAQQQPRQAAPCSKPSRSTLDRFSVSRSSSVGKGWRQNDRQAALASLN
jgi:hypothetical protein